MKLSRVIIVIICLVYLSINKSVGQQIPQYLECVKLNHLYRKASHNSYSADGLSLKDVLDITRVIELDVHSHKDSGGEADPTVWYVRHHENTNNKNNCVNKYNGSSNQDFGICLDNVREWSSVNQGHNLIIVFIDLKTPLNTYIGGSNDFFRPDHSTTHLNQVFIDFANTMGGADVLYKPSDLQGNFTDIRTAAQNGNWPSLGNLKNKIMFVLTGANKHLNEYLTNVGTGAMAFVAVSPKKGANPSGIDLTYPNDISSANLPHVAFYNLEDNQTGTAGSFLESRGLMSRSWQVDGITVPAGGTNTSPAQYGGSIAANINNIAITNIHDNNLNANMNGELNNIHYVTIGGGLPSSPQLIRSQYDNILQSALIKVTAQNLIVEAGTHYNIRAGEEVDLLPGVDIRSGANTDISIGNCVDYSTNLRPANTGTDDEYLEEHLLIDGQTVSNNEEHLELEQHKVLIYPNPTNGFLNIELNNFEELAFIEVYNVMGKQVLSKTVSSNELLIDITNQPKGIYFVKVTSGENSFNEKIIYQ